LGIGLRKMGRRVGGFYREEEATGARESEKIGALFLEGEGK
jgi:hypothetical protein